MSAAPQSLRQDACTHPPSMAIMTMCSHTKYTVANNTLNKMYEQLMVTIEKTSTQIWDKEFTNDYKKALSNSEKAWARFRDTDCNFLTYERLGGSSRLMNIYDCRTTLTNSRIKELQEKLRSFQ
ncbi:MAG: DUF1311 domain-containing protein [Gammaproteobacteria bacterium]|nr:DUF1311 domain-containing protein [Gammaproteobacteria bacterium]